MDEKIVSEIANGLAKQYGLKEGFVKFLPFRDLKIKWQRSSTFIHFELSDYLKDVEDDGFYKELLIFMFKRIYGSPGQFNDKMISTFYDCCKKNLDVFIDRLGYELAPIDISKKIDTVIGEDITTLVTECYTDICHSAYFKVLVLEKDMLNRQLSAEEVGRILRSLAIVSIGATPTEEQIEKAYNSMTERATEVFGVVPVSYATVVRLIKEEGGL